MRLTYEDMDGTVNGHKSQGGYVENFKVNFDS